MRILLISSIFPPDVGGPATYAWDVSERLRDRGDSVTVVTTSAKRQNGQANVYRAPRILSKIRYLRGLLQYSLLFIYILRAGYKSDVLFVQSPGYIGVLSLIASWVLRKPLVLRFPGDEAWERAYASGYTSKTLHEFLLKPVRRRSIRALLIAQRITITNAHKIVAPSDYIRNILIDIYGANQERVHTIYHSLDVENCGMEVRQNTRGDAPTLVYLGRLVAHKRVCDLIDALAVVANKYKNVRLYIVGDGREKQNLHDKARTLKVDKNITFVNDVSRGKAVAYLRCADVVVLPSLWESLSHVAIEALAHRVPIVATRIPGLDEVLTDGENSLLVPPRDAVKLANAICRLLEDVELARSLSASGRRKARTSFNWETNLTKLRSVLENAEQ